MQEYILKLREHGYPVFTELVVAAARGIAQAMDWTRLAEYGGLAMLTTFWAKSLLKRMKFTARRVTKCGNPGDELVKERNSPFRNTSVHTGL